MKRSSPSTTSYLPSLPTVTTLLFCLLLLLAVITPTCDCSEILLLWMTLWMGMPIII